MTTNNDRWRLLECGAQVRAGIAAVMRVVDRTDGEGRERPVFWLSVADAAAREMVEGSSEGACPACRGRALESADVLLLALERLDECGLVV